jgi:hypothetical protein
MSAAVLSTNILSCDQKVIQAAAHLNAHVLPPACVSLPLHCNQFMSAKTQRQSSGFQKACAWPLVASIVTMTSWHDMPGQAIFLPYHAIQQSK